MSLDSKVHGFRGPYITELCLLEADIVVEFGQHCVEKNSSSDVMNIVESCISALFCPFPLISGIAGKNQKPYQFLGLVYKKLIVLRL